MFRSPIYSLATIMFLGCNAIVANERDTELTWEYVESADEQRMIAFRAEFGFDSDNIARIVKVILTNTSHETLKLSMPSKESLTRLVNIRQDPKVFAITASYDLPILDIGESEIIEIESGKNAVWEVSINSAVDDLAHYEAVADYDEIRIIFLFRGLKLTEGTDPDDRGERISYILRWTKAEGRRVDSQ
ncbi:MAG: hypothetical protein WD071_07375 [Pseudohongiella sp.]|uniref:hypothetical protein n=1 Tax=Pseudohongiella sp. TaxID=1979412 RepID=UPI0034A0965A